MAVWPALGEAAVAPLSERGRTPDRRSRRQGQAPANIRVGELIQQGRLVGGEVAGDLGSGGGGQGEGVAGKKKNNRRWWRCTPISTCQVRGLLTQPLRK